MARGKIRFSLSDSEYESNAEKDALMFDTLRELKIIFTIPGIAKASNIPKGTIDKYTSRTKATIDDNHLQRILELHNKYKKLIDMFDDYIKVSSVWLPFDVRNKMHEIMARDGKKMDTVITEALIEFCNKK